MEDRSRGISTGAAAAVIVVLLVVGAGAYYFVVATPPPPTKVGASLTISDFNASYLMFDQTSTITVTVANDGDSTANNVVLTMSSPAFSNVSKSVSSITSASQAAFTFNIRPYDVKNGFYTATIVASYSDVHGKAQVSLGTNQVAVLPAIKIVGVGWTPELLGLSQKSTIGQTDSTQSIFSVESLSNLAQYSDLAASETFVSPYSGLSITPAAIQLSPVGPHGTTGKVMFTVASQNAPKGTYSIEIAVSWSGITLATDTVVLTVN